MRTQINPYKLFVGSFCPNWLLRRREISPLAKLVYARLSQYAGESGEAFPLIATLADEVGEDKRSVERAIAALKTAGLIAAKRRGLTKSNSYIFFDHPWMHTPDTPPLADQAPDTPKVARQVTTPEARQITPPAARIRESLKENHLKPLLGWWEEEYKKITNKAYRTTANERKQIQELINDYGESEVKETAKTLLTTKDKWLSKNITLSTLVSQWNRLQQQSVPANEEGPRLGLHLSEYEIAKYKK